jgi:hypothetical protein
MRRTQHGVVMSPRMERLWNYLDRMKSGLNDFSTDECVERNWAQLVRARDNAPTPEIRKDIENIMRRRPCNRVTGAEQSKTGARKLAPYTGQPD